MIAKEDLANPKLQKALKTEKGFQKAGDIKGAFEYLENLKYEKEIKKFMDIRNKTDPGMINALK